ncbi:Doubled CXXCH motif (Paired_CXXCH_1) [Planctomycetes bacterium MalM25]|nr:Doubled CXXCH motif (Paired_CXXCH_1) [Planctomycetes bacterium MalM25]
MPRLAPLILAGGLGLAGATALVVAWQSSSQARSPDATVSEPFATGQSSETTQVKNASSALPEGSAAEEYLVTVRRPAGPPRITLAGTDPQGRTGSVACSTCHSVRQPDLTNVSAATLDEFHQGMAFNHGKITCYACHNPDDADTLRLADGSPVAYQDVMTLCSQCHGPQATAFAHGAHGGMNGHWDLTSGPQTKNNCIDCHDPHAPNYPKMVVGFKPRDRFNEPAAHDHEGAAPHGDH